MRTLSWLLVLNLLWIGLSAQQTNPQTLPSQPVAQGYQAARNARLKEPVSRWLAAFPARTRVSRATLLDAAKLKNFIGQQEKAQAATGGGMGVGRVATVGGVAGTGRVTAAGGVAGVGRMAAAGGMVGVGGKIGSVKRPLGGSCTNKGFFLTVAMPNSEIYLECIAHTQDDGVLIAGELFDSTSVHPGWYDNTFLLKSDNNGNILWATLFVDQQYTTSYYINPMFIKEMADGTLMLACYQDDVPNDTQQPVALLYHLSATGTILWQTEYKATLTNQWTKAWPYFQIKDINPGQNGDYILSGTTVMLGAGAQGMTVVRIDANGNYIWDANLTNETGYYHLGAEGLNAFWDGTTLLAIGVSHGSSGALPVATIFATLDYKTGVWQSRRYWDNSYTNPNVEWTKNFSYYYTQAVLLNTGNYLVYGQCVGIGLSGDTTHYFAVQEFNPYYGFVKGYTVSALQTTPWENNSLYFDNTNNGFVSVPMQLTPTSYFDDLLYFAHLQGGQIVRQRVTTYSGNIESGWAIKTQFMNDGSYYMADDYYDTKTGSYFLMKRMYDTDTASECLGRDTTFFFTLPLNMYEDPGFLFVDPPVYNQVVQVSHPTGPASIAYRETNPCLVNSSCSLLQIAGQMASCGVGQPLVYTAHRNWGCGATPLWNIDTAAVSSVTHLNDSVVSIQFKNVNWQGKLYANILPGTCSMGAADSVVLSIIATPQAPDLVPDTVLCKGNTILLHAGPIYSSYQWQDGSTDSNYTVTQAGSYSVAVTDVCGNNYSSSSQVTAANFPFTLGPALTKCNNDSVTLNATGGYFNYQWTSTDLNQGGMADSVVRADPAADESFSVTAEKWAGCTVSTSMLVSVLHSPAIRLGDDTSFCSGGSVLLDAGGGFAGYQWNTGQTSQQISASQAGTYSIVASAANGCMSYDTLKVNAVYPLPLFSLGSGSDTAICSNVPLVYSFAAGGGTYEWSDGSGSASRTIDQPGVYGLTIVNTFGCSVSHSIAVTVKQAPVFDLGNDTTLCVGSTLVLDASRNTTGEQFLWQDGSTGPEYTVRTGGLYDAKAMLNGCSSTDSIRVSYIGVPEIAMGKDTTICEGDAFTIQPSLSYPGSFLWQDSSTRNNYVVKGPGVYSVEASNQCGSSSGVIHVVSGLCRLVMPNAFTPNQDGRNDIFRVKYPFPVSRFSMVIFDRWGQEIYATHNITEGWDGTIGGVAAPAGTYVWYISLTDIQQKTESGKGTLLLIR